MANANPATKAEEPTTEVQTTESVAAPKPKKAKEASGPKIEYFGEGAEQVAFEVDQQAKLIRVYSTGMVLVDY